MSFLNPFWLPFCAAPIVLAICAIFMQRRRENSSHAFVSAAHLKKRLITEGSSLPWWISTLLLTLATFLIFIALAEPTTGKTTIEIPSKGRKIYLAIDCSKSMLVKDITPDRLTVAKTAALEILEAFPQEKVGLISFAGSAWLEAPLTADHHALRESILEMSTSTIPYGGSSSTALLKLVTETHKEEDLTEALLIILSDGEFHQPPSEKSIKNATESGLRIFTLGFGTVAGDYIPDKNRRDGLFLDPRRRQPVLSTLKVETLEKIAVDGGGKYLKGDDYSFLSRLSTAVSSLRGEENTSKNLVVYNHIYYYFLIPALLLLFLSALTPYLWKMIKSPASAVLLLLLLPLTEAEGSPELVSVELEKEQVSAPQQSPPLSLTAEEQAEVDALNGHAEDALKLEQKAAEAKGKNVQRYRFSQGVAEYKANEFSKAAASFSESLLSEEEDLQAESHYNIGNSLYKFGTQLSEAQTKLMMEEGALELEELIKIGQANITQWEDALDHYTGALNILPDHAEARENYEYVKKQLEKLKEQQEEMMQMVEKMQGGEGEGSEKKGGKGGGDGKGEVDEEDGYTEDELEEKIKEAKEEGYDPTGGEEEGESGSEGEEETEPLERAGDRQENLERRPGESKEDYAERKLREGSDAETGNLKSRRSFFRRPEKDW